MVILKDILYNVSLLATRGNMEQAIEDIQFDSRKVAMGSLFIAIRGTQTDGHEYIDEATRDGAVAVVCEKLPDELRDGITYVRVKNSAEALGFIASNYFDNPSGKLKLAAITGTNGKTTTVNLLFQLFRKLGYNTGLLSTIHNKINDQEIAATHTTPDAIQLNALMAEMVKAGCTHCFMEASSHAIQQKRITGLHIDVAVFTNISHDHLDYHKTFKDYINAKKLLFDFMPSESFALINKDDKRGKVMIQNTKAKKKSFAIRSIADFRGRIISNTFDGLEMDIDGINAWFPQVGEFNAYNILGVYATAILLEEDPMETVTALSSLEKVPGRFEMVYPESGINAIVDYAHTPNALLNVLSTISQLRTGNETLITVVGCGGNRDRAKRPLMADIACKYSDKIIFTSDNPRHEDPEKIIEEMQAGVKPQHYKKTLVIINRKEAIKTACSTAGKNDIILVAGKGHETYQEIKGVRHDFDDRTVLKEMLDLMVN